MGTHADNFLAWIAVQPRDEIEDPDTMVWCWSNETEFREPKQVAFEELDRTRWMMVCEKVYKFEDGSFVSANYEDGLTENQEPYYEGTEWGKVEEYTETVTVVKYRPVS